MTRILGVDEPIVYREVHEKTGASLPAEAKKFTVGGQSGSDEDANLIEAGSIRRVVYDFRDLFSSGIAKEARIDWLRVRSTLGPIEAKLNAWQGEGKQPLYEALRIADKLLKNAKRTPNLNEAWASINQAGEWICFVADAIEAENEKQHLLSRMEGCQPELMKWIKHLDGDECACDDLEKQLTSADCSASERLSVYSRNWKRIHDWLFFSRRLWRLACLILLSSLVVSIITAEYIHGNIVFGKYGTPHLSSLSYQGGHVLPFIFVSLFGLFGGALSVLLNARSIRVSALTYASTRWKFIIRLLLGACGAFVVYTILLAMPVIFNSEILIDLTKSPLALIALGIAAGFSEKLFQDALDRISKRIPTSEPNGAETDTTKKANA